MNGLLESSAGLLKNNYFGFLNIYKPAGMTSHDVVACIRKVTRIKQVGHTGTLDPFAQGVLPVCIGKATRLIEFLTDDKEYIATVQFGKTTDTYDLEGNVTAVSDKKVTANEISEVLACFQGHIEQMPPIYSAIKVNGKKLYDYARQGQTIDIQPRKVFIEKIELLNFDDIAQSAEILVKCSKGTYIRSIAHDLGQKLGTGAYLTKLIRTKSGKFTVQNSVELDVLKNNFSHEYLINPLQVLELPVWELDKEMLEKVKHGQFLKNLKFNDCQLVILVYNKDEIAAVGAVEGDKIKTKKVFI